VATVVLTFTGLWILHRLFRPIDRLEAGIVVADRRPRPTSIS